MKDSDGEVIWLGLSGAGTAALYAKHGRLWRREAQDELFVVD
jgi:hypothetical protein